MALAAPLPATPRMRMEVQVEAGPPAERMVSAGRPELARSESRVPCPRDAAELLAGAEETSRPAKQAPAASREWPVPQLGGRGA
jgi:hypothetical protein